MKVSAKSRVFKKRNFLLLFIIILIQQACFFKVYKDSEEVLKSEKISEEEQTEERVTYVFRYSLDEEYLTLSISKNRVEHKQIIAILKEKYKDSMNAKLNDEEITKFCNSIVGIYCIPGIFILVSAESLTLPFRLMTLTEERKAKKIVGANESILEKLNLPDSVSLRTEYSSKKIYPIKNKQFQIPISELILFGEKGTHLKLILFDSKASNEHFATFIDMREAIKNDPDLLIRLKHNKAELLCKDEFGEKLKEFILTQDEINIISKQTCLEKDFYPCLKRFKECYTNKTNSTENKALR